MITLKDVAHQVGVSENTAAKVLNGTRSGTRVSDATRVRIMSVAKDLGYRPNLMARSLSSRRTNTIGLMLSQLKNPFFLEVLQEMERDVIDAGYQVLLEANISGYGQYHELRNLSSWLVDGVLLWTIPYADLGTFLGERAKRIPVVYLGHLREDGSDAVAMDLYGAGKLATEHLLARGYRRPCFVSAFPAEDLLRPLNQIPGLLNNQIPGFQEVCRRFGHEPEVIALGNPRLKSVDVKAESFRVGMEIAKRSPGDRPDAVICQNDWTALFVYNGLVQSGLRIPDDIALVGFDGIAEGKYIPGGPLTTVRMPVAALCGAALEILLKRIGGDTTMPPQQVLIPTELIVGGTT